MGLFLLRLITAGVIGVRAYQMINHHQSAALRLTERGAPMPETIAWVEAGVLAVIAVMLLFGFGTRVAAFLLSAAAIANIVFMQWGAFNPLREGIAGIRGDFELLLSAIGLALLVLGSGGWAIDGIRRAAKLRKTTDF
ncbi:MAG: DoxX family protein [Propionibacteriaceae bacterium]|jgi:putative oxidoreductase|nr:DoxX family protein [Propionibacteriaceae bacterium]